MPVVPGVHHTDTKCEPREQGHGSRCMDCRQAPCHPAGCLVKRSRPAFVDHGEVSPGGPEHLNHLIMAVAGGYRTRGKTRVKGCSMAQLPVALQREGGALGACGVRIWRGAGRNLAALPEIRDAHMCGVGLGSSWGEHPGAAVSSRYRSCCTSRLVSMASMASTASLERSCTGLTGCSDPRRGSAAV